MKSRGNVNGARSVRRASDAPKQGTTARARRTRSGVSRKAAGSNGSRHPTEARYETRQAGNGTATLSTHDATERATRRRFGVRGSAPWAARHAAKHAAESAARNSEPVMPGSARATLRTPAGAEHIKERIRQLHSAIANIKDLRRDMSSSFFKIGVLLRSIRDNKLYEAKGYLSFGAFADREVPLSKAMAMRLSEVPDVFLEPAALSYGLSAILLALDTLEESSGSRHAALPEGLSAPLPAKPPSRRT